MKSKLIIFSVLFFLMTNLFSQEKLYSQYFSIGQDVEVAQYQNRKFRFTGYIKKEPNNGNEEAYLWLYVRKIDDKNGFYSKNMGEESVTDTWKQFKIEGTIESKIKKENGNQFH